MMTDMMTSAMACSQKKFLSQNTAPIFPDNYPKVTNLDIKSSKKCLKHGCLPYAGCFRILLIPYLPIPCYPITYSPIPYSPIPCSPNPYSPIFRVRLLLSEIVEYGIGKMQCNPYADGKQPYSLLLKR